jgi:hypothetical protein
MEPDDHLGTISQPSEASCLSQGIMACEMSI